jgi:membrane protein DedA with SNARE-associated domain
MIEFINELNHWQIDCLATGLLLQGAIFGLIPEEIIMMTMGVLWSQGKIFLSRSFY